ncbi:helix-turn-helix transcriptional regulator [Ralstonia nicotianae]
MHTRDYELAAKISRAGDDLMVGPREVAAISGLSARTIGQRKISSMPAPLPGVRRLLWRLGDIRKWMRGTVSDSTEDGQLQPVRRGRPTKAEEVARKGIGSATEGVAGHETALLAPR